MMRFRATAIITTWLIATAGFAGDRNWEDWIRIGHEAWTGGNRAEALRCWQRAHEDSEVATHPASSAALEFNLATALLWFGRTGEAEAGFRKALTLQERTHGPSHPELASTLQSLAVLSVQNGRLAEAKSWVRRSLEIRKNVYGPEHPIVASSLNTLAGMLREEGRLEEAAAAWRDAIAICEQSSGSEQLLGLVLVNFGRMLVASGLARREAEEYCLRGRLILEKALGADHPYVALALEALGEIRRREGQYREAETLYGRALRIQRDAWPAAHPDTAQTLHELGRLMTDQRRFGEAATLFKEALAMREGLFGPDSPLIGQTLAGYAAVLGKTGHRKQAAAYLRRARAIAELNPGFRRSDHSVDVSAWKRK